MVNIATLLVLSLGFPQTQDRIVGNGNIVTESRPVARFSRIQVSAGMHLECSVGGAPSIKVESDSNIVKLIQTKIEKDTLYIRFEGRHSISTKHDFKITVTTPSLNALVTSGGVRANVTNLKNSDFALRASGGCEVKIKGTTTNIFADVSGGCNVSLPNLSGGTATLKGSGGCTITMSGSGKKLVVDGSGATHFGLKNLTINGEGLVNASGVSSVEINVKGRVETHTSGMSSVSGPGVHNGSSHGAGSSAGSDDGDDN